MKYIQLLFLSLVTSALCSQANLVLNPDFEDKSTCPTLAGNIVEAIGWQSARITPDYFHSCSAGTMVGVPQNWAGYQLPFSGNAYSGIFTYVKWAPWDHEFLTSILSSPLEIGKKYYVSAFIVSADIGPNLTCFTNNFGFKFTNRTAFTYTDTSLIDNTSHVKSDSVISEQDKWTEISGSFVADSAYKSIIIGNFYKNDQTQTNTNSCVDYAYYYVDHVCVSTSSNTCSTMTNLKLNTLLHPAQIHLILGLSSVNLSFPNEGAFNLSLTNLDGILLMEEVHFGNCTIDLSRFEDGIYFIKLLGPGYQDHRKLLILHY